MSSSTFFVMLSRLSHSRCDKLRHHGCPVGVEDCCHRFGKEGHSLCSWKGESYMQGADSGGGGGGGELLQLLNVTLVSLTMEPFTTQWLNERKTLPSYFSEQ